MKNTLLTLLLGFGSVLPAAYGQGPWVEPPVTPNYHYQAPYGASVRLEAPQPDVLWGTAAGYQGLGVGWTRAFCSTDNGQTWQTQVVASTGRGMNGSYTGHTMRDISFLDAQNAWLLKSPSLPSVPATGVVLARTTSGPLGFTDMPNPLPAPFQQIHFFTPLIGVAQVPGTGFTNWPIYRTTDGGATWTLVSNTPAVSSATGSFYYRKAGLANALWLTADANTVLRTADAGLSWTALPNPGLMVFADELHGLAFEPMASTPVLSRTDDGGQTWTPVPYNGPGKLTTIDAVPGRAGPVLT